MNSLTPQKPSPNALEKKSLKLLMEKMGLAKKELEQINNQYGVSSSQLLELMQYSKYQFVYTEKMARHCQPCKL